jgi:hypothetical protein
LSVKGRASLTNYSREAYGPAWYDTNGNGCDTRDDILRRDLRDVHRSGCQVVSGIRTDPYSGRILSFHREGTDSHNLDIDHVVALGDAWQMGAWRWTGKKRLAFANDPTNLLSVDPSANRQKGDADAASWLPANKAYRCAYVARQVDVKRGYGLAITSAEKAAMERVLAQCPNQKMPGPVHTHVVAPPQPTTSPSRSQASGSGSGLDPRFSTCKDAIAAGYGPYVRGHDPEYYWYRDADSDGIDCER